MKNHFFIPYFGNKRNEVEGLYNQIKDKLDDIKIIVEPFCGTSAFSYYLSLKHPKKFQYVLNDNNKYLIELYKISTNPEKFDELIEILKTFHKDTNKEKYHSICKEDKFENWFYKNKIYSIRPGLFPNNTRLNINQDFKNLKNTPILNFLNSENITFYNDEGVDIVKKYKDNKSALIFLDPPYIVSYNDFYYDSKINVYEYLSKNSINKMNAYMVLCLENNWIIRLLFCDFIKSSYDKQYESSKKKTTHLIITN